LLPKSFFLAQSEFFPGESPCESEGFHGPEASDELSVGLVGDFFRGQTKVAGILGQTKKQVSQLFSAVFGASGALELCEFFADFFKNGFRRVPIETETFGLLADTGGSLQGGKGAWNSLELVAHALAGFLGPRREPSLFEFELLPRASRLLGARKSTVSGVEDVGVTPFEFLDDVLAKLIKSHTALLFEKSGMEKNLKEEVRELRPYFG
jgi:hypothetical protein